MRRLSLLSLLLSLVAGAAPVAPANFSENQTCTTGTCARSAAPTSTAEGMELLGASAFRLAICAASGQTLSGAGTMQAYWCDSISGLCMRNPGLDQSVSASAVRCQVFPDFSISAITYFDSTVVFAASGVTVSGGATLTVYLYPTLRR